MQHCQPTGTAATAHCKPGDIVRVAVAYSAAVDVVVAAAAPLELVADKVILVAHLATRGLAASAYGVCRCTTHGVWYTVWW